VKLILSSKARYKYSENTHCNHQHNHSDGVVIQPMPSRYSHVGHPHWATLAVSLVMLMSKDENLGTSIQFWLTGIGEGGNEKPLAERLFISTSRHECLEIP
jgi:hypothetical protein